MRGKKRIPLISVERLIIYRRCLLKLKQAAIAKISSNSLGKLTNITAVNIRKDLSYIGETGKPGFGYQVKELIVHIEKFMGMDHIHKVVLIGMGNIGASLLNYQNWQIRGFEIVGAFDKDKRKVNRVINGVKIQNCRRLQNFLKKHSISIAILAIPAGETQKKVNELAEFGVKGFYIISPIIVNVPKDCFVEYLDMISPLEFLMFRIKKNILK